MKDFIVPHFNFLPYLDKPALASDLTALSFGLVGVSNLGARLVSILSALLGILVAFLFIKRLFNLKTAALTAVLLLTSIGYVLVGRFAVIDMLMTFLVSTSIFFLMAGYFWKRSGYYLLSYVFIGLAFLTKGLLGVILPGAVFLIFLIWARDPGEIKRMRLWWGIVIAGLMILPWCIFMQIREPDFFRYFIVEHHFSRFASKSLGRSRPFWFYIPIFIGVVFPWSLFSPLAFINSLRQKQDDFKKVQFLITWFTVIFIFFSASSSKLPYYILPVSVPFAVLMARFFSVWANKDALDKSFRRFMKWTWRILTALSVIVFVGLNGFLLFWGKISQAFGIKPFKPIIQAEIEALQPILHMGSIVILLGAVLGLFLYKKNKIVGAVLSLAAMIYLSLILTFFGMKTISPLESTYIFAEAVNEEIKEGDKVAVYSTLDHFSDFIFYTKKRMIVAGEDRGTLANISSRPKHREESQPYFYGTGDFVKFFNKSEDRVFCLLDTKRMEDLKRYGLDKYRLIKEGYKKTLISNK